jgi:hypothetical protein
MLGDRVRRQQPQNALAWSLLLLLRGFARPLRLALWPPLRKCAGRADGDCDQQGQQISLQRDETRSGHTGLSRFSLPRPHHTR